jgi:hypothetical protein
MSKERMARRLAAAAAWAAGLSLAWAERASAHGGATGAQDFLQDYGGLVFLAIVVVVGAGVVAWVSGSRS